MDVEHELPKNKVCSRCGTENLATAARCLECGGPLGPAPAPREESPRIDGKPGRSLPSRGWFPWRGLSRAMSVPPFAVLAYLLWPDVEGRETAFGITFLAAACLAIVAGIGADSAFRGGTDRRGGWAVADVRLRGVGYLFTVVDVLLRGVGFLFTAVAALVLSLFALLLAVCYCGSRFD